MRVLTASTQSRSTQDVATGCVQGSCKVACVFLSVFAAGTHSDSTVARNHERRAGRTGSLGFEVEALSWARAVAESTSKEPDREPMHAYRCLLACLLACLPACSLSLTLLFAPAPNARIAVISIPLGFSADIDGPRKMFIGSGCPRALKAFHVTPCWGDLEWYMLPVT